VDGFPDLIAGFGQVLTLENLAFALLGCVLGMLVGILPGFGPAAALSLLLPITATVGATSAIIMLAAISYGAAYGGTITAVLVNVPGEASSVATTLDGYQLAKKGRAGAALSIAAIGSFVGGTVGVLGFVIAEPLSQFALEFGPAEFFALSLLALSLVAGLAGVSLIKALISALLGLTVALVGFDPIVGTPRFTFGIPELFDGINMIAVIMGLFGVAELLTSIEQRHRAATKPTKVTRILPTRRDLRRSVGPIARGSVIGFFMGLMPGSPGAATSFASYVTERKLSKHPEEFGKGAIEGVAGPETANNALAVSGMIPLFTLGIPTSATTAILMGAFTINGLIPGPQLFQNSSGVAWTIIASMFVGNVILLILNIPLVRIWISVLKVPYPTLYAFVFAFMILGAYSITGDVFNIGVMLLFGVIGYLLRKAGVPLAPAALTIVLGSLMENSLRQSLSISQGSVSIFFDSPIATTLLVMAALGLTFPAVKVVRRRLKSRRTPRSSTNTDSGDSQTPTSQSTGAQNT
jgi:putative tricarboxylic transport membrane protein